ncbi:MAG: MFS transporter [Pseudomonadales bacterium]
MTGFATLVLHRYPALGSRLYRRYWLASFASVGATQLITLAQGWLIYKLSGSAVLLGVLGAAAALPNILMTLAGGVIADRFDKRRILMSTSLSITLLLGLLAWLDGTGQVAVWHVLTVAALVSLITGLDWPVRVSVYPQLVEREAFMSAVALNSFIWQATRMAIPALGGLLIAVTDTWVLFALGSLGFFTMFSVITSIPVRPSEPASGSAWQQVREGIGYIWHQQLFRYLILLTFVSMLFAQSYVQIMPVFSAMMNAGETGYGYLLSAGGVGSVVGTLLLGSVHDYPRLGVMMLSGSALSSAAIMLFAALSGAGWFYPALVVVFCASACASVFMISSMTVLQLSVPDRLRGRVMGIHSMGFSLMPLGGLILGALAEQLTPTSAVWLACAVHLACIAMLAVTQPLIRNLDGRGVGTGEHPGALQPSAAPADPPSGAAAVPAHADAGSAPAGGHAGSR